jgi:hypothetical protein
MASGRGLLQLPSLLLMQPCRQRAASQVLPAQAGKQQEWCRVQGWRPLLLQP